VAYDVFASATRKDIFMICETWQNQEVLDKHSATPEFAENVGIMQRCGTLKLESFTF
jgi:quinol monooxygenase YgiN